MLSWLSGPSKIEPRYGTLSQRYPRIARHRRKSSPFFSPDFLPSEVSKIKSVSVHNTVLQAEHPGTQRKTKGHHHLSRARQEPVDISILARTSGNHPRVGEETGDGHSCPARRFRKMCMCFASIFLSNPSSEPVRTFHQSQKCAINEFWTKIRPNRIEVREREKKKENKQEQTRVNVRVCCSYKGDASPSAVTKKVGKPAIPHRGLSGPEYRKSLAVPKLHSPVCACQNGSRPPSRGYTFVGVLLLCGWSYPGARLLIGCA